MSTAIIYYSKHHGNTKKLLDAIAARYEVTLVDVTAGGDVDLEHFDVIGIASGIYYSSYAKPLLEYARNQLPSGKKVFFISTYGAHREGYYDAIRKVTSEKNCTEIGTYGCLGYDTFGPFKLVGGLCKGHPDQDEISGAVDFYGSIS